MNTSLGYAKKTLTNSNVLLSGGGDKALSEFIGSLNWDSTNKKLQYKSASSTNFTDLITFGSNAFTSYSGYNIVFLNNAGTTVDTFKALTSPSKILKAGTNVQMTAASNVITITATDTTYSTVSKSAAGLCPALPNETTTAKYLRLDGSWVTPPDNNTWRGIYVGGASKVGTGTNTLPINFVAGSNVSITYEAAGTKSGQSGNTGYFNVKISATDTKYSNFVKSGSGAKAGLVPAPSTTVGTTHYLREDGSWAIPTNTWKAANTSQEGYVPKLALNATDTIVTQASEYVLTYKSGTETAPVWRKLPANAFSNTWTANAVGVAGYVAAPTKAANANMVWKTDSDGNPAWRADANDNTLYYLTLNGTVNGTSGKTNLGTIWAPSSKGTGFLKCNDGTWSYDNTTYATPDTTYNITVNISYSGGWADTGILSTTLATGTYAVQVYMYYSDLGMYASYWSGVMTWYADSTNQDLGEEILLHCASHYTSNDIYLRTLRTAGGVLKLLLACDTSFSSKDIQFKFRKLI